MVTKSKYMKVAAASSLAITLATAGFELIPAGLLRTQQQSYVYAASGKIDADREELRKKYLALIKFYQNQDGRGIGPLAKLAQGEIESGLRPSSVNRTATVCGTHATGVFQISQGCNKKVAKENNLELNHQNLLDPEFNTRLSNLIDLDNRERLKKRFPDCDISDEMIIAAYGTGPKSVKDCNVVTEKAERYIGLVSKKVASLSDVSKHAVLLAMLDNNTDIVHDSGDADRVELVSEQSDRYVKSEKLVKDADYADAEGLYQKAESLRLKAVDYKESWALKQSNPYQRSEKLIKAADLAEEYGFTEKAEDIRREAVEYRRAWALTKRNDYDKSAELASAADLAESSGVTEAAEQMRKEAVEYRKRWALEATNDNDRLERLLKTADLAESSGLSEMAEKLRDLSEGKQAKTAVTLGVKREDDDLHDINDYQELQPVTLLRQ